MKKKILLMLLLGGMTLMPTSMMAKSDYGWDDNAEILRFCEQVNSEW